MRGRPWPCHSSPAWRGPGSGVAGRSYFMPGVAGVLRRRLHSGCLAGESGELDTAKAATRRSDWGREAVRCARGSRRLPGSRSARLCPGAGRARRADTSRLGRDGDRAGAHTNPRQSSFRTCAAAGSVPDGSRSLRAAGGVPRRLRRPGRSQAEHAAAAAAVAATGTPSRLPARAGPGPSITPEPAGRLALRAPPPLRPSPGLGARGPRDAQPFNLTRHVAFPSQGTGLAGLTGARRLHPRARTGGDRGAPRGREWKGWAWKSDSRPSGQPSPTPPPASGHASCPESCRGKCPTRPPSALLRVRRELPERKRDPGSSPSAEEDAAYWRHETRGKGKPSSL